MFPQLRLDPDKLPGHRQQRFNPGRESGQRVDWGLVGKSETED